MSKLLLVDGTNFLYRAYHGLPDLRTSAGEPTGALKGFYNMLGMLLKLVKPDAAACVFDAKGPTFRNAIYPAYKANRPPMPDDLRSQVGPVQELTGLLGWPMLVVPSVETDDVIGTLAKTARAQGMSVFIATGDKDMAQLVDESTFLVNTMTRTVLDVEGVKEKFGVKPSQMIDYLALMGDAVDNVPGIEKCGPKTAAKWLAQYETLEALAADAPNVPGKIGENLRKGLDFLPVAKDLVTIRCELDASGWLPGGIASLSFGQKKTSELEAFAVRWEMQALRRSLASVSEKPRAEEPSDDLFGSAPAAPVVPAAPPAPSARTFEVKERIFFDIAEGLPPGLRARTSPDALAVLDGFTDHTDGFEAEFGALAVFYDARLYVTRIDSAKPLNGDVAAALHGFLAGGPLASASHKRLSHALANLGVGFAESDDVEVMSYVREAHLKHDLASIASRLGLDAPGEDDVLGKGAGAVRSDFVADDELLGAFASRAKAIAVARAFYLEGADEHFARVYGTIEKPLVRVLFVMERNGVNIDAKLLQEESAALEARLAEMEKKIYDRAGAPFNIASPRQLSDVLFSKMGLTPPPKTKKTAAGAYSTSEEVLSALAQDHPVAGDLLEYRRIAKLKSTYTDKLPQMICARTGRIHTRFSQTTAVTGRLASSDPNLQNIPVRTAEGRRVREAFVAGPGSLIVSADYSQIELRIMAHLSGDAGLVRAFAQGLDIHRATAAEVFGKTPEAVTTEERRAAKVINFGLIYGMSAFGLSQNLGIEPSQAKIYIERYFERYPRVKAFMQAMREQAHALGYVQTAFGRRLFLPEIESSKVPVRQAAERQAINAPMQGTAADLIKLAMIATQEHIERRGLGTRLVLQVHDELVLEVPEGELQEVAETVPRIMAGVAELAVPLIAQVGSARNWEAAH